MSEMSPSQRSAKHESAGRHVSGKALYIDDFHRMPGLLHGVPCVSTVAAGRIKSIDISEAVNAPGVVRVALAKDIPGDNCAAPIAQDEPLMADSEILGLGQTIALVIAKDPGLARDAVTKIKVDYVEEEAIPTIQDAIAKGSFQGTEHKIKRGDVDVAFSNADLVVEGEVFTGGQDHFYLETQCAQAMPTDDDGILVQASTQHPSEAQAKVAEVLGIGRHQVVVECPRMGGAFGGKETQAGPLAQMAALGVFLCGKPVRVRYNRDQDMLHTGKRHPWFSRYKAGFSKEGKLLGVQIEGFSNGGWSLDLSESIMQRYLFHLDNAYYIENLDFVGKITKTTVPSNTAFRGFGGPQGVVVIESILNHGAEALGLDPAKVRKNNFYGDAPKNRTPYDQEVVWEDNRVHRIYDELMESTHYFERRMVIESENEKNPFVKRGIAFQPVKFGISFTAGFLNQAGALVLIYADGTVQLNHGGTEMGQGLHTKMIAVCSHELGVLPGAVRIMKTATDKVPNTSATAASSGSDLNGQAVQHACRQLKQRLRPLAAELLGVMVEEADQLAFMGGYVFDPSQKKRIPFSDLVQQAYMRQISLSSTGFYRTPNIHYDSVRGVGKPFHYFAYGGAVVEVEVSALTGEYRLKKVDILHDVGNSLVPSIDIGQVEGGFVQGFGWLTMEKLIYDENGLLLTHAPSTYKIPAFGDTPRHFKVALLERAGQEGVIHRSKAVGEPPFMLAVGVVTSLRHAIRQFSSEPLVVNLDLPATPEEVLKAIYRQQGRL